MLYEALIGQKPFETIPIGSTKDLENDSSGYVAIYSGKVREYMEAQGMMSMLSGKKSVDDQVLVLLEGLLNVDEDKRWTASEVIKATYFEPYYKAYYSEILQLRRKNKKMVKKMKK